MESSKRRVLRVTFFIVDFSFKKSCKSSGKFFDGDLRVIKPAWVLNTANQRANSIFVLVVTCRRNIYESMQRKFRSSMNMTHSKDNQQQNIEIYYLLVVVLLQQKMVRIVLLQRTFDNWIKFLLEYWVFNERLSLTELLSISGMRVSVSAVLAVFSFLVYPDCIIVAQLEFSR